MKTLNMMDSGTVFLQAADLEEAVRNVRQTLEADGGTVSRDGSLLSLDFSGRFYRRIITALVEETSAPGRFAVSFREGNAARWRFWILPSRRARLRMDHIRTTFTK